MATSTVQRPTPRTIHLVGPRPTTQTPTARLRRWARQHRASLTWLVPLLLLATLAHAVNMTNAPQRFDDEGTYVAQAFAVGAYGELTHYTYFYDHPPLGWLQLSGWLYGTGALARYDSAVMAGREFMLAAALVSALLLWLLARRLHLSRPAAAVAVALFTLSPLAVQFHRAVYLDNIATPWLLAALVLALNTQRQLLGQTAAGAAFAVAVLSKETYLLFLPFLAWLMWRSADRSTRRYTLAVSAAVFVLVTSTHLLMAALKSELLPGENRTSLWQGLIFQLFGREGSGWVFDAASDAHDTVSLWWRLDPALTLAAPVAALLALASHRLRPLAAAVVFSLVFMLRPGYLPIPYVVALLPLAALLIPGVIEQGARAVRTRWQVGSRRAARSRRGRHRRHSGRTGLVRVAGITLAAATVATVVVPLWSDQLRYLLRSDVEDPMRQAVAWIEQNVGPDERLIVDDSMWVDLVRAGFDRDQVVWFYKVDTDPAVAAQAPDGWVDYDYVVSTNSIRAFPDELSVVGDAIANSTVIASYGEAGSEVEIRRVITPVDPL